jgi:hypothetical protein
MFRRLLVAVALLAGLLVALPLSSAYAQDPSPSSDLACPTGPEPVLITANVTLTHDLSCSGIGEWRILGAVVDLGGHTITVSTAGACDNDEFEFPCTFRGGTVRNGELVGVNVQVGLLDHVVMRNSTAQFVSSGGQANTGDRVTRSVFDHSRMLMAGSGEVTHSLFVNESSASVDDFPRGLDFTLTDSLFIKSGIAVNPSEEVLFRDDVVGTIERNAVVGGNISIGGNLANIGTLGVAQNLILGSSSDGLNVSAASGDPHALFGGPVTVTGNIVLLNRGHGIDASWIPGRATGVVDGGGNIAFANATQPQCLGVQC